ncbi:MAG: histidine triad nucleotide-binding protein [Clostridia bacterium]|nr:histidine triad nucleotide-binding protein [Clostridia bacterium]
MDDCLFCKIISGAIPSTKVYEDDKVYAFRDIAPQAPVHVLLVPKKHISGWSQVTGESDELLAHLMRTAAVVAKQEGLEADGYRIVSNCGQNARQSVPHLHLHILGGRELSEKMN